MEALLPVFLHAVGNVCMDKLRLKIDFKPYNKTRHNIQCTAFVDSFLIALQPSLSLTEATINVSLYSEKGNLKMPEGVLHRTD
jgi:hypothetical protein